MDCNSVKERLVDFLYEELPAESRTAFEEHLRGCAGCKAEVASYRSTLGSARSALSGTLAQEPPARVRPALMEAARTAIQAKAGAQAAEREEPKLGFFSKLWRTPWLMPAFGAASVATAVFLVRVLKNPEVLPGQRARSIGELTEPAPLEELSRPAPHVPAEAASAGRAKVGPEKLEESSGAEQPVGNLSGGRAREAAREMPRARREDRKGSADGAPGSLHRERDSLSGMGAKKAASAGAREERGHGTVSPERPAAPLRFAEPPPPRPAESAGAAVERRPSSKDMSAPAGSGRVLDDWGGEDLSNVPKAAPAQRAAAPAPETAKPSSHSAGMAASPMPAAPPAPAATVAQPARRSVDNRAEVAAEKEASYAPAVMQDESSERKKAKAQPWSDLDENVRRADRLFTDRNWSAAAEAYRDLLRRYPSHGDAGKWRARMEHAVLAAGAVDQAGKKSAKAKTGDDDTLQRAKP
jgi:hypothetical protein